MNKLITSLKLDALFAGIPAVLAYLFGVEYTAILPTLFILILADQLTGIAKALKKGEEITSWGLRRTLNKILLYSGTLIGVYHISTLASGDLEPVISMVANVAPFYIAVIEFKSIIENAAAGGLELPGLQKLDEFLSQRNK